MSKGKLDIYSQHHLCLTGTLVGVGSRRGCKEMGQRQILTPRSLVAVIPSCHGLCFSLNCFLSL